MSMTTVLCCLLATAFVFPSTTALHFQDTQTPKEELSHPPKGYYEAGDQFRKRGITFSITAEEPVLWESSVPYPITVYLRNGGPRPVKLLTWGSPFEKTISNSIFRTEPNTAAYLGAIVSRRQVIIKEEHTIILEPGQELNQTFNLQDYVAFHNNMDYKLIIDFNLLMYEGRKSKMPAVIGNNLTMAHAIQQIMTASTNISVHGMRTQEDVLQTFLRRKMKRDGTQDGTPTKHRCSGEQDRIITTAKALAARMTDHTISAIERHQEPKEWTSWFGYSEPTYPMWDPKVLNIYNKIKEVIWQADSMVADCGTCKSDPEYGVTFAYVYPIDPVHTIYLCGVFWEASNTIDRDSQPGTFIHEMSHYLDTGGTKDTVYGTEAIKELARVRPEVARTNADNIEAYSETLGIPRKSYHLKDTRELYPHQATHTKH